MMIHKLSFTFLLTLCTLLLTGCGSISTAPNTSASTGPGSFAEQLRRGGHVIFIRHAATDHSQKDVDFINLADCTRQRNLNELGRQQSHQIGAAFRDFDIPVGDVKTSLFCRCIDTARLAFAKSEPIQDITSIQNQTPATREQRIAILRELLAKKPENGTNTIIVGHKWMFKEASGQLLEEGEAAIYQPQDDGSTVLVKRIRPENWNNVMQPAGKSAAAN